MSMAVVGASPVAAVAPNSGPMFRGRLPPVGGAPGPSAGGATFTRTYARPLKSATALAQAASPQRLPLDLASRSPWAK